MGTSRPSLAAVLLAVAAALPGCSSSGSSGVDFLNPPRPVEPLDGSFLVQAEVPNYGRRGWGTEIVEGELTVTDDRFELRSTHGACGGPREPDQPGRQRIRCQGIELDLEWIANRWGGRITVQIIEVDEEEVCVQRNRDGVCTQTRVETRERPARRSADVELTKVGGSGRPPDSLIPGAGAAPPKR